MNFFAQEIARYDEYLTKVYHAELFSLVWAVGIFAVLALVILLVPQKYLKDQRWGDNHSIYRKKKSRYRNGRKLSREELEAERTEKKYKRRKRKKLVNIFRISFSILLVCVDIFMIFDGLCQLDNIQKDMDENAYIVYEGQYKCAKINYKGNTAEEFSFTDENGRNVILRCHGSDFYWAESGTHTGRLVYSQNSEYLIELELNT